MATTPDGPARGTIDETDLLSTMAVRFVRVQAKVLGDLSESLTYRQYITLARIGEGHRSIVALARLARLTLPTVSQSVDGLVKRGLVARSQDEHDRRLTVLSLTPAGAQAVTAARSRLRKLVSGLLDRLDDDGRHALTATLVAIHDWADEEFEALYAVEGDLGS